LSGSLRTREGEREKKREREREEAVLNFAKSVSSKKKWEKKEGQLFFFPFLRDQRKLFPPFMAVVCIPSAAAGTLHVLLPLTRSY
jgi:hypothetical protein